MIENINEQRYWALTSIASSHSPIRAASSTPGFEREVTGERIRDKIAVSKRKGMWMGGVPLSGYDAEHRRLIINDRQGTTVRRIFGCFVELGSATVLRI